MKMGVSSGIVAILAVAFIVSIGAVVMGHNGQTHTYQSGKSIPQNINNILNNIGDTCPLSGDPIENQDNKITYKGEEVLVCCEGCALQFSSLPELDKPNAFQLLKAHLNGEPLKELGGTHTAGDGHPLDEHYEAAEQGHTDGDGHTVGQHITGLATSGASTAQDGYKICSKEKLDAANTPTERLIYCTESACASGYTPSTTYASMNSLDCFRTCYNIRDQVTTCNGVDGTNEPFTLWRDATGGYRCIAGITDGDIYPDQVSCLAELNEKKSADVSADTEAPTIEDLIDVDTIFDLITSYGPGRITSSPATLSVTTDENARCRYSYGTLRSGQTYTDLPDNTESARGRTHLWSDVDVGGMSEFITVACRINSDYSWFDTITIPVQTGAQTAAATSGTSYKLCRNDRSKTFTCSDVCLSGEVIDPTFTAGSYSDCTGMCSYLVKETTYLCNTPSGSQAPSEQSPSESGRYVMCADANLEVGCSENACPGESDEIERGFSSESECNSMCNSLPLPTGFYCAQSPPAVMCSTGNYYVCRTPSTGDNCQSGETTREHYTTLSECNAERDRLRAVPAVSRTCEQACKQNAAKKGICAGNDVRVNYNGYSTSSGYFDLGYGSGRWSPLGSAGEYQCSASQQCTCFSANRYTEISFSFFTQPERVIDVGSEEATRETIASMEARGDLLLRIPSKNPTANANPTYVDSIQFCDVEIKSGQTMLARSQGCGNEVVGQEPLYLSADETSSVRIKGRIDAYSTHCEGLELACLQPYRAGCSRVDEFFKEGYRPNSCFEGETKLASKAHLKTNWAKPLAILCGLNEARKLRSTDDKQKSDEEKRQEQIKDLTGLGKCAAIWLGAETCPDNVRGTVKMNTRGDITGATLNTPAGGIKIGDQGVTGAPGYGPVSVEPTRPLGSEYSDLFLGYAAGCGLRPGGDYNCYSVCGRNIGNVREPPHAPSCNQYKAFPLAEPAPRDIVYSCNPLKIPSADNPIKNVSIIVQKPDGTTKEISMPVTNSIFDSTITLPADLDAESIESGAYHISIGKVSKGV